MSPIFQPHLALRCVFGVRTNDTRRKKRFAGANSGCVCQLFIVVTFRTVSASICYTEGKGALFAKQWVTLATQCRMWQSFFSFCSLSDLEEAKCSFKQEVNSSCAVRSQLPIDWWGCHAPVAHDPLPTSHATNNITTINDNDTEKTEGKTCLKSSVENLSPCRLFLCICGFCRKACICMIWANFFVKTNINLFGSSWRHYLCVCCLCMIMVNVVFQFFVKIDFKVKSLDGWHATFHIPYLCTGTQGKMHSWKKWSMVVFQECLCRTTAKL